MSSIRTTFSSPIQVSIRERTAFRNTPPNPRKTIKRTIQRNVGNDFGEAFRKAFPVVMVILCGLILYNTLSFSGVKQPELDIPIIQSTPSGKDAVTYAVDPLEIENIYDMPRPHLSHYFADDTNFDNYIFNPQGESECSRMNAQCKSGEVCYSLPGVQLLPCVSSDYACSTLSEDYCLREPICTLKFAKSCTSGETLSFCRSKKATCSQNAPVCAYHPDNMEVFHFNDGCLPEYRSAYSLELQGKQFEPVEDSSSVCCGPTA